MPIRVFLFLPWAEGIEDAGDFVRRLPGLDLRSRVAPPSDERLLRMARLDCDWHGETVRCVAAMRHPRLAFLPPRVLGPAGMAGFLTAAAQRPSGEAWWLLFTGQHPRLLGGTAGRLGAALKRYGVRLLWYAFDEVSRTVENFDALAPHLDGFIHDESPLADGGRARLSPSCLTWHRSWVANVVPWETVLVEAPEPKIMFLGSQLGLTPHRVRQIEFLQRRFKDRFTAIHDHSVAVGDRCAWSRYQVSWCPEGRKFATPAMAQTHTDRPFWSGCLGMVPVAEDSAAGGRLEALAAAGLVVRYRHADLAALAEACERALAATPADRRRIYDHFNAQETVGGVIAEALAALSPSEPDAAQA